MQEQPADASDRERRLASASVVESADPVVPDVARAEPTTVPPVANAGGGQSPDRSVGQPGGDASDTGPSPLGGRGRIGAAAVGLAVVLVVAAGLGWIVLGGDDDRPEAAGVRATPVEQTTTTVIDDLSAEEAFARAADRLVSGGSFGYVGTTSAIDVSHVRPGLWLAVNLTVEGQVVTSTGRVHEIAVDGSGRATETVTEGPAVWGRLATSREGLPEASYLSITEESGVERAGKGVALLPTWLDSTVNRQDAGSDDLGNRVFRATLPASVLGEIVDGRAAGDADVVLTLDAAGDPVRVEVASVPAGPPLRLALDLIGIGEPVLIDLPVQ